MGASALKELIRENCLKKVIHATIIELVFCILKDGALFCATWNGRP